MTHTDICVRSPNNILPQVHKHINHVTFRVTFLIFCIISEPTDLSGTVISVEEMWKRVDLHEMRVNDNPPLIPEYNTGRKTGNRKSPPAQRVLSAH